MFSIFRRKTPKCRRPGAYTLWAFVLLGVLTLVTALASSASPEYRQVRTENVAQGVKYYHFQNELYPVSFNMVKVNWRERLILPRTALGDGFVLGLEPVSRQAQEVSDSSRYAVAAINGDFYKGAPWDGVPTGVFVVERELVSAPTTGKSSRSAFIIGEGGRPDVDNLVFKGRLLDDAGRTYLIHGVNQVRGAGGLVLYTPAMGKKTPTGDGGTEVVLSSITGQQREGIWKCYPGQSYRAKVGSVRVGRGGSTIPRGGAVLSGTGSSAEMLARLSSGKRVRFKFDIMGGYRSIKSAIGGWPVLVENGKNIRQRTGEPRHPRTVIGYNNNEVILAVVDGRRTGWSRGMTLYELGELMERAKCKEAINLDGGGSSALWVRGRIRNKPSDGRERPVANTFVIYSSAPKLKLSRLAVDPSELSILVNEEIQFTVAGQDKYYNPADFNFNSIKWQSSSRLGKITGKGTFYSGANSAEGYISASHGSFRTKVNVHVYTEPPIFQIFPTKIHLFEGDTVQFRTLALDHRARKVIGSYDSILKWEVAPSLGTVDQAGFFKAGNNAIAGNVMVSVGRVLRQAKVTVGTRPKVLDGFERASMWSFSSHPDNRLRGSFQIRSDAKYNGKYGGQLKYVFDGKEAVQACYARSGINIGSAMGISLWVKGDGSGHIFRMAVRDRFNSRFTYSFNDGSLKNTGWHQVTARIPIDSEFPLKLESIYVLKNPDEPRMSGIIKMDDLMGLYPPE